MVCIRARSLAERADRLSNLKIARAPTVPRLVSTPRRTKRRASKCFHRFYWFIYAGIIIPSVARAYWVKG